MIYDEILNFVNKRIQGSVCAIGAIFVGAEEAKELFPLPQHRFSFNDSSIPFPHFALETVAGWIPVVITKTSRW